MSMSTTNISSQLIILLTRIKYEQLSGSHDVGGELSEIHAVEVQDVFHLRQRVACERKVVDMRQRIMEVPVLPKPASVRCVSRGTQTVAIAVPVTESAPVAALFAPAGGAF